MRPQRVDFADYRDIQPRRYPLERRPEARQPRADDDNIVLNDGHTLLPSFFSNIYGGILGFFGGGVYGR
jgi:hypothetical protein